MFTYINECLDKSILLSKHSFIYVNIYKAIYLIIFLYIINIYMHNITKPIFKNRIIICKIYMCYSYVIDMIFFLFYIIKKIV